MNAHRIQYIINDQPHPLTDKMSTTCLTEYATGRACGVATVMMRLTNDALKVSRLNNALATIPP